MKKGLKILISISLVLAIALSATLLFACKKRDEGDVAKVFDEEATRGVFLSKANEVVVTDTTVTFTDDSGEEGTKSIPKNPQKVFVMYASLTTLWYEAGGTAAGVIGGKSAKGTYQEYIGRDLTKDAGVETLATSPSGKNWDADTIIAKQPDLIICALAMSGYSTIAPKAEVANIPVIAIDYSDFSDYLKWFKVFSEINNKSNLWNTVAGKSLNDVVDVLKEIPTDDKPTVFSIFAGPKSFQANLSATVVGGMITQLGGINIADEWENLESADRLDINLESVLAKQPKYILVQSHAEEETARNHVQEQVKDNPLWPQLDAVKNDKVYYLDKLYFHNKPNSKFAKAYQDMAKILYPDVEFSFEK